MLCKRAGNKEAGIHEICAYILSLALQKQITSDNIKQLSSSGSYASLNFQCSDRPTVIQLLILFIQSTYLSIVKIYLGLAASFPPWSRVPN